MRPKQLATAPLTMSCAVNMITREVESVEDALTMLQATVFEPEFAAPLIRRNIEHGLCSNYEILFFKGLKGITMSAKVTPCYKPKLLGRHDELE